MNQEDSVFEQTYRCYPLSFIEKVELEKGDKIIMPPSALHRLGSLEIDYPMLFQLTSPSSAKSTHCGVLEFTAEEGLIYIPSWMMESVVVEPGDVVDVRNVSLPKGTYVKLQPHNKAFLDVSNPRVVLEKTLRSYSCLTSSGTIAIFYNDTKFYVDVVETKPSPAVCIIETDCEVDFAPPLDYVEPAKQTKQQDAVEEESEGKEMKFSPFSGSARRLDGKPSTQKLEPVSSPALKAKNDDSSNSSKTVSAQQQSRGLVFGSNGKRKSTSNEGDQDLTQKDEKKFKAFTGNKYSLKG